MPTKMEVSEPLIVLAITSRPHLSAPEASRGATRLHLAAAGVRPRRPGCPSSRRRADRRTSRRRLRRRRCGCCRAALGRLDLLHDVGERIDEAGIVGRIRCGSSAGAGLGTRAAAVATPPSSAITSPMGSTTSDSQSLPGVGCVADAAARGVAPAGCPDRVGTHERGGAQSPRRPRAPSPWRSRRGRTGSSSR